MIVTLLPSTERSEVNMFRRKGQPTVFVSYSHKSDAQSAPRLRMELHNFGRPWHVRLVRQTLIDRSDLKLKQYTDDELGAALDALIDTADSFALLASPGAASSRWVDYEVGRWLQKHGVSDLLLVLTDGEIRWSSGTGDFDWELTNSLPKRLKGAFKSEPLYLDLRGHQLSRLWQTDNSLRRKIGILTAAVDQVDVDSMLARAEREQRRTRIARWVSFSGMLIILVLFAILLIALMIQRMN